MFSETFHLEVEAVYERLYQLLGVTNDSALSEALGLSPAAVRNARNRQSLPWEGIVKTCADRSIDLNYVFGVEVEREINRSTESKVSQTFSVSDAVTANALVEKILDDLMFVKNLPADKELFIRSKLRPMLFDKTFEYQFNEVMVRTAAEGALYMA
ncbi:helix-turn-helix domain-containing protein [Pseudoalteromonas luteoviolacea]|uniref:helix-turn-helix domain-containing protein n=1 Tax=Pseudoalteromonas luteoviolacea TaxID=43657 RepID=UPI001B394DA6|nr:helix-turn-helix domain-containing protein [Pseudoalteromonas luteoviolacea]MBQ4814269.1 helix-turn-helix domain-containing protein [Pseudoalteromonas luteoviolacea]